MKKIISLFAILLSSLIILSGCNDNDTANSNIMISVYLEGTDDNKSIEIYNNSLEEIKLNNYSIGIFKIGNKEIPNINIKLSGILEAKKCYVISNDKANSDILAKTNLKTADLSFGGIEGVALMHNNTVLDVIGSIGLRNQNANMTLVRKVDCTTPSTTFDQYNYFRYQRIHVLISLYLITNRIKSRSLLHLLAVIYFQTHHYYILLHTLL